jgi:autotransporter-associated beta strand protein
MGTLDVNDLEVGISSGAGSATGNVNLGGGTTTVNNTVKATLLGGRTVGTFGTGNLNISGSANVNIAAFGGTSLILGDAVAAGSATGAVNLTGGTLTVAGDIIRGTATGTSVATLALNGASATLDMGGNDITGMTGITYTAGLLKNLGTVNTGMTLAGTGSRVFDQTTGVNGDIQGEVTGSGIGFTKQGDGKLTLSGTNTYDGATLVSAGTLFVTGSLTSDVTVSDAATFGGGGTVQAISFGGGSFLDIFLAVNSLDSLASSTISFAGAGFGIDNLVSQGAAVDWNTVLNGNYTLITGGLDETNLANFGLANAVSIGGGRSAYFEEGSLTLVVIPEPRAALLGGLGLLALLRRRRH